jgi:transcriptional regulator with XRE-family HTH domain
MKDKELKKLGAHVRELRKAKDMTQQELAHMINKDQQSIQRLEAGNMNPTFIYLGEIAKGLKMTMAEFFSDYTIEE